MTTSRYADIPRPPPAGESADLAETLEAELVGRFGMMLGSEALREVLNYRTRSAYQQAIARDQVPVPLFPLRHRRGRFALAKDVAAYLARMRQGAIIKQARHRKGGRK